MGRKTPAGLCEIFLTSLALFAALTTASAGEPVHEGVASCAGGTCHGAAQALKGSDVRQDEYLTWQRKDRHAQAYAALLGERGRRIAANLGLGEAAGAPACLACHADPAKPAARGVRFQISDGVSCESCHGAAGHWLGTHVKGYPDNAAREKDGLYPMWDAQARAERCLACHQGDAQHPMTHAIMGAGHPVLLFESDTFVALEPAHFDADADYLKRKGAPDGVRNWIAAQAVAARNELDGLNSRLKTEGLFPELAFFDCNACHHAPDAPRWRAELVPGLGPGHPRVADAGMHFVGLWLQILDAPPAAAWNDAQQTLHTASQHSLDDLQSAAADARKTLVRDILPMTAQRQIGPQQRLRLAHALAADGQGARSGDFTAAQQTAMALAVLITDLGRRENRPAPKTLRAALDRVFDAVNDDRSYKPAAYREALAALDARLDAAFKPAK